jgi:hypothetical protein
MIVVTLSPPLLALMIYSQVQGFILALCLLTLALSARYPIPSGITLGIAIALKAYAAPLLAFLFLTRRYRIFTVALLTSILGALLPGYFDNRLSLSVFLHCGLSHVQEWTLGTGNQSALGILKGILEGSLVSLGFVGQGIAPLIFKTAAPLLWLGSGAVMGALFRRRRDFEEGFLAVLALSVVCAPVVWSHYYIFVWPYLIRIWREIPFGSKVILWLSLPLMPWYVAEGPHSLTSVFTNPPGTLLSWLPGLICIAQFLVILFHHTIRPALAHPGQNKSVATV